MCDLNFRLLGIFHTLRFISILSSRQILELLIFSKNIQKTEKTEKTEKNSVFTKSSMKIDFRGIVLKNTVFSVFSVFLCGSTTKKNN